MKTVKTETCCFHKALDLTLDSLTRLIYMGFDWHFNFLEDKRVILKNSTVTVVFPFASVYYRLKLYRPLLCPAEIKGKSVTDHQQDT